MNGRQLKGLVFIRDIHYSFLISLGRNV